MSAEHVIVASTTDRENAARILAAGVIEAKHSYDVPEIIAIPITGGSADYLSWLVDETRGAGS